MTYQDVDTAARAIAVELLAHTEPGQRALLLYPSDLHLVAFFGCLYAGIVAVPVYPPRLHSRLLERDLERIRSIVADSTPALILTTSAIQSAAELLLPRLPQLQVARWIPTDRLGVDSAGQWQEPSISDNTIAFLQYTSGSTTTTQGVMVTHANLMANQKMIQVAAHFTPESCMVTWLPLFHDMGLIGAILQPCYTGFPCVFMSPESFLQRPMRWLEAIDKYRGTAAGGPNFGFELCVRRSTPAERDKLDLSTWTLAFNGAEPIRAETLDRFAEAFRPSGFRAESFFPVYGLAEATLFVAGGPYQRPYRSRWVSSAGLKEDRVVPAEPSSADARRLVGCALVNPEQSVAIVNPTTGERSPPDGIGEIWLAGPHVAKGYWHDSRPEDQTFTSRLSGEDGGPYLRTGDLGFVDEGLIYITGRSKDLIIIEGRNHYPQDIEQTVESCHAACRPGCCAAFSIESEGERLVIVQEVRNQLSAETKQAVVWAIQRAVSEQHSLRPYAVVLIDTGMIPKTSSGKIQRRATREQYLAGRFTRPVPRI